MGPDLDLTTLDLQSDTHLQSDTLPTVSRQMIRSYKLTTSIYNIREMILSVFGNFTFYTIAEVKGQHNVCGCEHCLATLHITYLRF